MSFTRRALLEMATSRAFHSPTFWISWSTQISPRRSNFRLGLLAFNRCLRGASTHAPCAVGSQSRGTPVRPLASRHRVDAARAPHLRTPRAASGGCQRVGFHGDAPCRSTSAAFVCAAPRSSALPALDRAEEQELRAKLLWRRATSRITTSTCAMPVLVARTS